MNRQKRIEKNILSGLKVENLEVLNNSHLHKGHLGDDGTMETHYKVVIKSDYLSDMSRVSAHKEINRLLKGEFDGGLHALEIKIVK